MSFEDIKAAREARAAKDIIKSEGKCGQKRKSAALEADELEAVEPEAAEAAEPETEAARAANEVIKGRGKHGRKHKSAGLEAIKGEEKRGRKRKSAVLEADELEPVPESEVARMIKAPKLWTAPVVRMI